MRKTKTIEIDGRTITVMELKVKDIKAIFSSGQKNSLMDNLHLVTTLTPEEIDDLYPSEFAKVWEAIQEVNSDFLDGMDSAIPGGFLKTVKKAALMYLTTPSAGSSSPDTGTSGSMDTVSS